MTTKVTIEAVDQTVEVTAVVGGTPAHQLAVLEPKASGLFYVHENMGVIVQEVTQGDQTTVTNGNAEGPATRMLGSEQ